MSRLIFVVDADPAVQRATCHMLQEAGYTCLTADTAIDALTYLKNGRIPALAILDIQIHDLPGTKLALRVHERYAHIPILFVSGRPWEPSGTDRLASIRWEFLQKPFTGEALVAAVRRLLDEN